MSIKEKAKYLGVSRQTLWRWTKYKKKFGGETTGRLDMPGPRKTFTSLQRTRAIRALRRRPLDFGLAGEYWSVAKLRQYFIDRRYTKKVWSRSQLYRLLNAAGIKWTTPRRKEKGQRER